MSDVDLETIGNIIERVTQSEGLDLVDWDLKGGGSRSVLRIVIDRDEGITHDDCVAVTNEVGTILDVEDPIPFKYTLEVTSPGLGRSLSNRADFDRRRGEIARIRTSEPQDGRLSFKGRIETVTPNDVTIVDAHDQTFKISYANILAANLVQVPTRKNRGADAGGEL